MNPILTLTITILLISCNSNPEKNNNEISDQTKQIDTIKDELPDTLFVQESQRKWTEERPKIILCGIPIEWDNLKSDFVENSEFSKLKLKFKTNKKELIEEILNEENTEAWSCNEPKQLTIGEISFVFIDKIESIPLFEIFGMQWDSYNLDCPYPYGLLDYVSSNRTVVVEKLTDYFKE